MLICFFLIFQKNGQRQRVGCRAPREQLPVSPSYGEEKYTWAMLETVLLFLEYRFDNIFITLDGQQTQYYVQYMKRNIQQTKIFVYIYSPIITFKIDKILFFLKVQIVKLYPKKLFLQLNFYMDYKKKKKHLPSTFSFSIHIR